MPNDRVKAHRESETGSRQRTFQAPLSYAAPMEYFKGWEVGGAAAAATEEADLDRLDCRKGFSNRGNK